MGTMWDDGLPFDDKLGWLEDLEPLVGIVLLSDLQLGDHKHMTAYISVPAGSSVTLKRLVKDELGQPVNLSTADIEWTLAREAGGPPVLTKRDSDGITGEADGSLSLFLSESDTALQPAIYAYEQKIRVAAAYLSNIRGFLEITASSGGSV